MEINDETGVNDDIGDIPRGVRAVFVGEPTAGLSRTSFWYLVWGMCLWLVN